MTYYEKLRDQRWQKKRLQLLEAAGWQCQSDNCLSEVEKPTLHVHHKLYLRKHEPWDYPDYAYSVLCEVCHEVAQDWMEKRAKALAASSDLELLVNGIVSKALTNENDDHLIKFLHAVSSIAPLRADLFRPAADAVYAVQQGISGAFSAGLTNGTTTRAPKIP